MNATKPTEEQEELRSKLDYEGQLIWRFGQFYNNCEGDDILRAKRSLRNIWSFLTPDLREKIDQRTDYENIDELVEETKEEWRKEYHHTDEEIEEAYEEGRDIERPMDLTRRRLTSLRVLAKSYDEIPKDRITDSRLNEQLVTARQVYNELSERTIPKLQKYAHEIIAVLDQEGLLQETRRIGHGTEE